jgi:hypothetical protein
MEKTLNKYRIPLYTIAIIFGAFFFSDDYFKSMPYFTNTTDYLLYFTCTIAITTFLHHVSSLASLREHHNEIMSLKKYQFTADVCHRVSSVEINDALQIMNTINKRRNEFFKGNNVEKFLDFLKEEEKNRRNLLMLLNYFEYVSVLVNKNHIDELTTKDYIGTIFLNTEEVLRPYIHYRSDDDHKAWSEFSTLTKKWRSK